MGRTPSKGASGGAMGRTSLQIPRCRHEQDHSIKVGNSTDKNGIQVYRRSVKEGSRPRSNKVD
eukprot:3755634-Amphidinium_carterae.1